VLKILRPAAEILYRAAGYLFFTSASNEEAYSEGDIPDIFLNCFEK